MFINKDEIRKLFKRTYFTRCGLIVLSKVIYSKIYLKLNN